MERLISPSSLQTPLSPKPHLLHFIRRPLYRSGLLRPVVLGPTSAAMGPSRLPPRCSSSLNKDKNAPLLLSSDETEKKKRREEDPSPHLVHGRGLVGPLLHKVASVAVSVLLSASLIAAIQPFLAPPAHATIQTIAKTRLFRTELLSSAWTGFLAGCLHTLSGPDHLAALAPLSIGRTKLESAAVGALWGCGHDAGQLIFGLVFLLLKDRLQIEVIRTWGTRVVGLTLLAIGAAGIREASEVPAPCVALENGEYSPSIIEPLGSAPTGKKKIGFATFATGIVHGLQPDAMLMILPALALPSRLAGAAFLGMFLIGTVFAMGTYTVFIGSCSEALKDRVPRITEKLTWAASLVAISMGIGILISQLFGFSLY